MYSLFESLTLGVLLMLAVAVTSRLASNSTPPHSLQQHPASQRMTTLQIALLKLRQRDIYEERSALDKAVRQHEIFLEAVQLENDARGNRREDV